MKTRIFRLLSRSALLLCTTSLFVPTMVQAETGCAGTRAAVMAAMLKAVNITRSSARSCGSERVASAEPLIWNDQLVEAAVAHSRDMAGNNFFSHTGSDGLKSWDRAAGLGYSYRTIGENISAGRGVVASTHAGLVESPGHCRNIMNSAFTEMGAACVTDPGSYYGHYWTIVFGTRL